MEKRREEVFERKEKEDIGSETGRPALARKRQGKSMEATTWLNTFCRVTRKARRSRLAKELRLID